MKANYTHISILLDRSGSMGRIKDDVIEQYNEFLKTQKAEPEEATITLAQFDSGYEVTYNSVPLKDAQNLSNENYIMQGMTALHDATVKLIKSTGVALAAMKEQDRPSKVLFVTITDGHENASKEYNQADVKKMIEHQESKYNWEFVYLGANQDSKAAGGSIGIKATATQDWVTNSVGTRAMFSSLSNATMSVRKGKTLSFDSVPDTKVQTVKEEKQVKDQPATDQVASN